MDELGIVSLDELAERAGSDKGNLSRIFNQKQRPRVDVLEPLAAALEVSIYELLVRIGAVDPVADPRPTTATKGRRVAFTWPRSRG